jgi:DNA-binding transcriptional ArsR family regulator
MSEELVDFFKALADSSRLKIIGLLAQQPYSVEELAALLKLKPSTVSHHLARLSEAGLVSAKAEGYYSVYQLEEKALEARSRSLFSQDDLNAAVADIDLGAYDNKVLKDYMSRDGSLKTLPAQRKKLEAVLRYGKPLFGKASEQNSLRLSRRYSHLAARVDRIWFDAKGKRRVLENMKIL